MILLKISCQIVHLTTIFESVLFCGILPSTDSYVPKGILFKLFHLPQRCSTSTHLFALLYFFLSWKSIDCLCPTAKFLSHYVFILVHIPSFQKCGVVVSAQRWRGKVWLGDTWVIVRGGSVARLPSDNKTHTGDSKTEYFKSPSNWKTSESRKGIPEI